MTRSKKDSYSTKKEREREASPELDSRFSHSALSERGNKHSIEAEDNIITLSSDILQCILENVDWRREGGVYALSVHRTTCTTAGHSRARNRRGEG